MSDIPYRNPHLTSMHGIRPRRRGRWGWVFVALCIWAVPSLILMGIMGSVVGVLPVLVPIASLFGGIWASWSMRAAMAARRKRNGAMLLAYVEMAVRLNLPLEPLLIAAEHSERRARARQIRAIHQALAAGASITTALQAAADIPDAIIDTIAAHEPIGQIAPALAHLRRQQEREDIGRENSSQQGMTRFYPLFILFFACCMVMVMMIVIIPKFREIFRDFRVALPPETLHLMAISQWVDDTFPLVIIVALLGVLGIFSLICLFLHDAFLPALPLPRLKPLADRIAWITPGWRQLVRDQALAQSCQLLADATQAGVPLPAAMELAQRLPVNRGFKRQLAAFHAALLQGAAPAQAAAAAGLPGLLAGMLGPMPADSAGAMFAFLARHYREKFGRTLTALNGALTPMLVLAVGSMVFFVVYACFIPVITLIKSMEGYS